MQKLAEEKGATCVDSTHFVYLGGQVRSLLSLISYLGTGEYRERYLGLKIPPTNLQPDGDEAARKFATGLADRLAARRRRSADSVATAGEEREVR